MKLNGGRGGGGKWCTCMDIFWNNVLTSGEEY